MLSSLLVKDYMIGDHLAFNADTNLLKAVHTLLEHGLSGAAKTGGESAMSMHGVRIPCGERPMPRCGGLVRGFVFPCAARCHAL